MWVDCSFLLSSVKRRISPWFPLTTLFFFSMDAGNCSKNPIYCVLESLEQIVRHHMVRIVFKSVSKKCCLFAQTSPLELMTNHRCLACWDSTQRCLCLGPLFTITRGFNGYDLESWYLCLSKRDWNIMRVTSFKVIFLFLTRQRKTIMLKQQLPELKEWNYSLIISLFDVCFKFFFPL